MATPIRDNPNPRAEGGATPQPAAVKHFSAAGKSPPLWYWRTAYGDEVDLLVEQGGRFTAFKMNFSERPDRGALKGFTGLTRTYGVRRLPHPYPLPPDRPHRRHPGREHRQVARLTRPAPATVAMPRVINWQKLIRLSP